MRLFLIFLAVSVVLLSGCVEEPGSNPLVCPEDVKVCPDGSTVSRDPYNNCLFPDCGGNEPLVCAADVKVCPDGSTVSRDPYDGCMFPPCVDSYDVAPDPMTGLVSLTDSSKGALFSRIASEGDSALAGLVVLSSLEYLDLSYSGVSDISALSYVGGLKEINLSYTSVSDLGPLAGMNSLESLNVSYSNVADLSPLAGMSNLKKLWAASCGISDVSSLEEMTGLTQLNLKYNSISTEDCTALKNALPSADVYC